MGYHFNWKKGVMKVKGESWKVQEVASLIWVQYQCSREMGVLEIPLDKELTANCLVETRTKLKELIPGVMVKYGLTRVQFYLWLQQSLINGISWNGMSWAIVVMNICKVCWSRVELQSQEGIVHLKSPVFLWLVEITSAYFFFWSPIL